MDSTLSKLITKMVYDNFRIRTLLENITVMNEAELRVFLKTVFRKFKSFFDAYLIHVAYKTQFQVDVEYISRLLWSHEDAMNLNSMETPIKSCLIPDIAWISFDISILDLLTTAQLNCVATHRGLTNEYPRSMLLDYLTNSNTKNCSVISYLESMQSDDESDDYAHEILNFPKLSFNSYIQDLLHLVDRL